MKTIRLLTLSLLLSIWATTAWAQYTLYGAPEVIRLPDVHTSAWAQRAYPTTEAGQAGPVYTPILPAYGAASVPVTQPRLVPPSGSAPQSEPGTSAGHNTSVISSMLAESNGIVPIPPFVVPLRRSRAPGLRPHPSPPHGPSLPPPQSVSADARAGTGTESTNLWVQIRGRRSRPAAPRGRVRYRRRVRWKTRGGRRSRPPFR